MSNKRQDYISWDEYFMGVALLTARQSVMGLTPSR